MTFTEAAVEVLRLVGKPLHYKKITELAIERNLLSHVGKTPEVTMSSRLATLVKRDRGEAPLIKVKPGVFGLREFNEQQLADLSGDIDELPEAAVENEETKSEARPEVDAAKVELSTPPVERRPLPGSDVFPEEADDDEPIFGNGQWIHSSYDALVFGPGINADALTAVQSGGPDGHPNSPTCGHLKFPHPERGVTMG